MVVAAYINDKSQLLARAGQPATDYQAYIMPFQKPVNINNSDADEIQIRELNSWRASPANLFSGKWINTDAPDSIDDLSAPAPLEIPQVHITPALKKGPANDSDWQNITMMLNYMAVIQGKDAGSRVKYIIRSTIPAISAAIMQEALNGYSTVFTGAYLRSVDFSEPEIEWIKVSTVAGLLLVEQEQQNLRGPGDPRRIGLWCESSPRDSPPSRGETSSSRPAGGLSRMPTSSNNNYNTSYSTNNAMNINPNPNMNMNINTNPMTPPMTTSPTTTDSPLPDPPREGETGSRPRAQTNPSSSPQQQQLPTFLKRFAQDMQQNYNGSMTRKSNNR